MSETFNINYWRKTYQECHELGEVIQRKLKEKKRWCNTQEGIDLIALSDGCRRLNDDYLDNCGIRAAKKKWNYEIKDETTHYSSDNFIYRHCV